MIVFLQNLLSWLIECDHGIIFIPLDGCVTRSISGVYLAFFKSIHMSTRERIV